jgi:hypothetical protein
VVATGANLGGLGLGPLASGLFADGETLTGLFLAAYLGLSVPVLGLGLAVQTVPVRDAVLFFAGVLLVLTALLLRRFTQGAQAEHRNRDAGHDVQGLS